MKRALSLFAIVMSLAGCYMNHQVDAEKQANKYASKMMPGHKAVSCTNLDTDGDGYVACTIRDAQEKLIRVDCAGAQPFWLLAKNTGCKMPKTSVNVEQ